MKRKIIALVLTTFMMLGVVGCSTEGLNLYNEMNKVAAWEYQESKGTANVAVEGMGVKVVVDLEVEAYTDVKNNIAYSEVKVTKMEMADTLANVSIQPMKISPVKLYVDKEAMYISKSFYIDLFAATGSPLPVALQDVKAEYIGLDLSQSMQEQSVDEKAILQLLEKMFKDTDVKLPIVQKDREYTMELNSEQMVDLTVEYLKVIINNMDEISKYANGGIKKEDLEMIKAQKGEIESAFEQGKAMVKPIINGSNVSAKYAFKDDSYTQSLDMLVKLASGEDAGTMKVTVKNETKKVAKKDITLPTSKVVYTMEQFTELFMPAAPSGVEISADKAITKNKETYVPLKLVMSELGYPVNYNAKTKKTSITVDGKEIVVATIVQKGTSYIALSELSKIGFTFTKDAKTIVILK